MAASFCTRSMRSRDKFPILFREFLIYDLVMGIIEYYAPSSHLSGGGYCTVFMGGGVSTVQYPSPNGWMEGATGKVLYNIIYA